MEREKQQRNAKSKEMDDDDWTEHDEDVSLQVTDLMRQSKELRRKIAEVHKTCSHWWVFIEEEDTGKKTWLGSELKYHYTCEICGKEEYDYAYRIG